MVLKQDFKERHAAAFMITKIRSFKRETIFFGGGGGRGAYSWYFAVGVNGTPLSFRGCIHAPLCNGGTQFDRTFVIASDLWVEAIVGLDFIRAHKLVIDCSNNTISFKSADVSVELLPPKAMVEISVAAVHYFSVDRGPRSNLSSQTVTGPRPCTNQTIQDRDRRSDRRSDRGPQC